MGANTSYTTGGLMAYGKVGSLNESKNGLRLNGGVNSGGGNEYGMSNETGQLWTV